MYDRAKYIKNRATVIARSRAREEWLKKHDLDNYLKDRRLRTKKYHDSPKGKYKNVCYCARLRGISVEFSQAEFLEWWGSQKRLCIYCDVPESKLDIFKRFFGNTTRFTIDRLDNSLPYRLTNIGLACSVCNVVKGSIFGVETMRSLAQRFIKPLWRYPHCPLSV